MNFFISTVASPGLTLIRQLLDNKENFSSCKCSPLVTVPGESYKNSLGSSVGEETAMRRCLSSWSSQVL